MLSRYIRSINDLLARTSHQRTTSEKRTKPLLPKCPLFGGSTVHTVYFVGAFCREVFSLCSDSTDIMCRNCTHSSIFNF